MKARYRMPSVFGHDAVRLCLRLCLGLCWAFGLKRKLDVEVDLG